MARTGRPTLCLVPTRVLLHQWRAEIAKLYDGPIGRLGDGEIEAARISVATFESAYRRMHEIGNRFDLVVVDEAHHFGTGARDETLEMCTARARLGLTATPPEPATPSRLVDLVGPTVYELAVGELAGKWLAPFEVVVLELRLSPDERRAHEEWMGPYLQMSAAARQANPWGNWRDLVRTLNRSAEGRAALAGFRKARRLVAFTLAKAATVRTLLDRHRGSRVLVFTADNASAYAISREHLVMPITCDIGRKERDLALARFRRGEIRVLVSARVLNEGLDVPDAEVAIVVGATQGAREHVQRVGRLLRPAPGKRAVVYELVTIETSEVGKSHWRRKALGDVPAPLPR
jgi:superfamily II DNA or RNA helicase